MIFPLVLASALLIARPARADALQAQAAYNAKQYGRCAELWAEQSKASEAQAQALGDALYNQACCQALDGKPDQAFDALDKSIAAAITDSEQLQADADLASLHSLPRWPRLLAALQLRIDAYEKTLGDPALHRELIALVREDQAARAALMGGDKTDKKLLGRVIASDEKTTARMKEVVAAHGWPGKTLVGIDGAHAAWLLVQHADRDVPFQKLCLGKMKPLWKSGEVTGQDYAYLVDRALVGEKKKQVYGTQFDDKREPQPIEDEAHVDERRKQVGLPSMAVYKQQMIQTYGAAPQ